MNRITSIRPFLITLPALALLASSGTALAQAAWVPTWADEFDGTTLNLTNWEYMLGNGQNYGIPGWGNNELQTYTSRSQNIGVANGLLTITARREPLQGYQFTSARIRSQNRREFTYGRFEARIKVPSGQGIWPAFWMLPTNSPYGGWAASGEMDILETINAADQLHGTIHHGSNWPNNTSNGGSIAGNWSQDFHTYAMEWEPDEIRWYVNGTRYYRVTSTTWFSTAAPNNPRAPFDTPFHLLLNVAVGGNWPGNPTEATPFPAQLQVDYVRVSQRPSQGPYAAQPILPARIEAERFDLGGGSIAYNDVDPENRGNQLRMQEAVDIENCSEGGHNVGFFSSGEWMEYTVQVPREGQYELRLRYATQTAGCSVGVSVDGVSVGASAALTPTGAWQTYRTVRVLANLTPGTRVIRITNAGPANRDFNLNWMEILQPGDANADGFFNVDDLFAYDSGGGIFRDIDADGNSGTGFDRARLLLLFRGPEKAGMIDGR